MKKIWKSNVSARSHLFLLLYIVKPNLKQWHDFIGRFHDFVAKLKSIPKN